MNKLKNYWDYLSSNGQTYQMGAQLHRVYLFELMTNLGIKSFLDTGCGTAPLYQMLVTSDIWKFKYKGVDYSEGMIEVCKKEFPEGDFEVEDSRNLTEKDKSWDCVVMMHVLDHLDDYQAAISEAARVAEKYVILILWRPLTENGLNNLNDKNSYGREEGQWEDTHLQEYSLKKLQEAFEQAGLEIVEQIHDEKINPEGKHNTLFLLQKYENKA